MDTKGSSGIKLKIKEKMSAFFFLIERKWACWEGVGLLIINTLMCMCINTYLYTYMYLYSVRVRCIYVDILYICKLLGIILFTWKH